MRKEWAIPKLNIDWEARSARDSAIDVIHAHAKASLESPAEQANQLLQLKKLPEPTKRAALFIRTQELIKATSSRKRKHSF